MVPPCQVSLRGRGLPHQCAHWFAMTCKRQKRVCGCKGDFPAVHRQCPGFMRTRGKFQHVIARSEATWQSASPAAAQSREQRLRRIRRRATDLPEVVPTWQVSLGGCGLPRRGAAAPLLAMTCRRRVRFCVCKDMGRDGVQKEEARVGVQGRVPAVFRQCPLANADTRHVLACHCEERSDVAIPGPAEILGKQVLLRANS